MHLSPAQRRFAIPRLIALLVAAAVTLGLGAEAAFAQSAACMQLNTMLQSLNSNGDVQNAGQSSENLRAIQANEANAERAYVRTGCQAQQDQRLPQTPQCRGIAQQILGQRAQIAQLSQSTNTGVALSRQRQQVMQQLARYGCANQTSGATFSGYADRQPPPRRNFLQQLFGGGDDDQGGYDDGDSDYNGQQAIEAPEASAPPQNTIRTVCVRMSDAYYWPISYSTTRDYIPQDTATCEAECPNQQVGLYFYDNPGQQPEQMVSPAGQSYASLPNAFAYRKQFDLTTTCKPQIAGTTTPPAAVTNDSTAPSAPTIASAAAALPIVATADIPLPRPRPDDVHAIAATAATVPVPTPAAAAPAPSTAPISTRVVKVGDKLVRVVGPDTPYAPTAGTPG